MTPSVSPAPAPAPADSRWRSLSFWWESLPGAITPRPALAADLDVDVAIVGAGYTGLWTAYYLAAIDPGLRVAVLEREVAGFGASGRNGGWCSAYFAVSDANIAKQVGLDGMHAMRGAMEDAVDEVGKVAAAEGIECHYRKGGSLRLARTAAHVAGCRAEVEEARHLGLGEDHARWCEPDEAAALVGASDVLGGTYTPHCASIHPARLVRGLADAVERRGVTIFEETPVERFSRAGPGGTRHRLSTPGGRLRADVVVVATEGYTATLAGQDRTVAPLYSLMVATEPLEASVLEDVRIDKGITFTDGRHLVIYGQRTVDGRIAFGGRGAPYHFGSSIDDSYDRVPAVHDAIGRTLVELFPALDGVAITHRWGGPLGVHRDWYPSVAFDRANGLASAGGYAGDGVSTTNLAGRTLAHLVCGRETDETRLCWVGHRSPQWEPEPLRWLGINAGLAATRLADRAENRTGGASPLAALVDRLTGH